MFQAYSNNPVYQPIRSLVRFNTQHFDATRHWRLVDLPPSREGSKVGVEPSHALVAVGGTALVQTGVEVFEVEVARAGSEVGDGVDWSVGAALLAADLQPLHRVHRHLVEACTFKRFSYLHIVNSTFNLFF